MKISTISCLTPGPGLMIGTVHAAVPSPSVPEISAGLAPMAIAVVVGIAVAYKEFTRRK
jgi:hypothetical protein